jgi:hypothetical protein
MSSSEAARISSIMGFMNRSPASTALQEPIDILLADIAIRVQLTATDYGKAVSRYQTINDWLEREDSALRGRVRLLYAQGSMAIGANHRLKAAHRRV